jgi:hypothetical protein
MKPKAPLPFAAEKLSVKVERRGIRRLTPTPSSKPIDNAKNVTTKAVQR